MLTYNLFSLIGLEKTSVKFISVTIKAVERCTARRLICAPICGGTQAIGPLFARGIIVVNGLPDPMSFR